METCSDSIEFQSHLKMVEILSSNRNLENEVKKGEEMLVVDIEKMPSYNIGLEKGIEKGKINSAIVMIEKFKIPAEEVAKEFDIPLELLICK